MISEPFQKRLVGSIHASNQQVYSKDHFGSHLFRNQDPANSIPVEVLLCCIDSKVTQGKMSARQGFIPLAAVRHRSRTRVPRILSFFARWYWSGHFFTLRFFHFWDWTSPRFEIGIQCPISDWGRIRSENQEMWVPGAPVQETKSNLKKIDEKISPISGKIEKLGCLISKQTNIHAHN